MGASVKRPTGPGANLTLANSVQNKDDKILQWLRSYQVTGVSLVAQSCLTLCDPMDCSPPGSSVHWDSPGKNTGMGCHALLQGIFPTQGSNPGFPHWRQILYWLSNREAQILCIYYHNKKNWENKIKKTPFYNSTKQVKYLETTLK